MPWASKFAKTEGREKLHLGDSRRTRLSRTARVSSHLELEFLASRRPRMSGSCCARLQRANVEFAAVERPREQSCQNPSKSLAPWPERLHMRPVLHTQKHGWRLRCAASLLRFARQPCFCVCSTWPHVQTALFFVATSVLQAASCRKLRLSSVPALIRDNPKQEQPSSRHRTID